jgi:hypothetical protein
VDGFQGPVAPNTLAPATRAQPADSFQGPVAPSTPAQAVPAGDQFETDDARVADVDGSFHKEKVELDATLEKNDKAIDNDVVESALGSAPEVKPEQAKKAESVIPEGQSARDYARDVWKLLKSHDSGKLQEGEQRLEQLKSSLNPKDREVARQIIDWMADRAGRGQRRQLQGFGDE